jgi:tetratricopeptide (TPR) repeat protein
MSTSLQRAYTAAISLNNMGVYLLEHGCYDEAREAFQDAISVMREISSTTQKTVTGERPPLFSTLDEKLHNANYNLAHCDPTKGTEMNVCVLTEEESAPVIGEALQDENMFFNSSTTYLVRIEKSIRDCKMEDVDLDSSIMLHNYGSLYECMSIAATTSAGAKQTYQSALRLFELSHSLLRRDVECTLPVLILILRGLVSISSMLGMQHEAEAYYSHALDAQDYFLAMHSFLPESMLHSSAAAA